MHPLRHGAPDIPNNENDSILTVLGRLKDKFPEPEALKREVQVWGIEKAGFFQFLCGFPPLCNPGGSQGAGMTPAEITAVQAARKPSFKAWRAACVDYFNEDFGVAEYGIAPRAYPTELLNRKHY